MVKVIHTLGYRLKSKREQRNLQQNKVAAQLGIHNSTLAKYESGERDPDTYTLIKLADLYEVTVDWLLKGTDNSLDTKENEPHHNAVYLNGTHEILTENEANHIRDSLEMYRLLKQKKEKDKS